MVALQAIRRKAGSPARISHASCRMNLYIVHVVVVGRDLEKDRNYCCPCCPEDEGEEEAALSPPIKGRLSTSVGSGWSS